MTYGLGLSANSGSPGNPGYVDWQQPHTILSRVAETEIIFGSPVLLGASDRTVKAPDGSNSPYIGIACITDGAASPVTSAPTDRYHRFNAVGVIVSGLVCVRVYAPATTGEQAYFAPATGRITNDPAGTLPMRGVFETSANHMRLPDHGWRVLLRLA